MRLARRIRSSSLSALAASLALGGLVSAAPEESSLERLVKELQRYLDKSEKELERLRREVEALKEAGKAKDDEIAALKRDIEALKKGAPTAPKEAPVQSPEDAPKEPPRPAARLGLKIAETAAGLHVGAVEPGETGDVAGIASGDRIVAIDGKPVSTIDEVREALKGIRVGDRLSITYEREGKTSTVVVLAGSRPGEAKRLEEEKPAAPAYLGIQIQEGLEGLVVVGVDRGGPAERAGIRPGDGILAIGGRKVSTYPEILAAIRERRAGDRISLRIRRGGEEREIADVVLGAREGAQPPPPPAPGEKEPPAPPKPRGSLGIEVEEAEGVLRVAAVLPEGSSAGKIEVGDVILAVQGKPVRTLEDLRAILGPLRADEIVLVKVRRGEEEKELEIRSGAWKE